MTITTQIEGNKLTVAMEGRLDIATAPELEKTLNANLEGITELVLDMEKLFYLSSAGLRVVLAAQKRMNKCGHMTVKNVCAEIMEVFEITGFVDILDIQ